MREALPRSRSSALVGCSARRCGVGCSPAGRSACRLELCPMLLSASSSTLSNIVVRARILLPFKYGCFVTDVFRPGSVCWSVPVSPRVQSGSVELQMQLCAIRANRTGSPRTKVKHRSTHPSSS